MAAKKGPYWLRADLGQFIDERAAMWGVEPAAALERVIDEGRATMNQRYASNMASRHGVNARPAGATIPTLVEAAE